MTDARRNQSDRTTSYDVRIWKIRTYEGRRGKTYSVRWSVAGSEHHKTYKKRALADARRAELLTATREGTAFDIATGLPVTELRQHNDTSWYEHACNYVDMKWDHIAGAHRASIADALATVTPALLANERGKPQPRTLRTCLYQWVFNKPKRTSSMPPDDLGPAVKWLERNTLPVSALADARVARDALDALARKTDGKPAAANTFARKRAVFSNLLDYAVEEGLLHENPVRVISWTAPKAAETVNPRAVVNKHQAESLLAAVARQGETARRLHAFFGCLYYAGLRPAEAINLRTSELEIPQDGWGSLLLGTSAPSGRRAWNDSGQRHEQRGLKHRAEEETRPVPCPPPLTRLLRTHLRTFGTSADGRLFIGARGQPPTDTARVIWRKARQSALTPTEYESPLARRLYDLRHACLSTWLNAGVPATQVAEWAGHSVAVLLRVYAKCVTGQDELARRRIDEALGEDSTD